MGFVVRVWYSANFRRSNRRNVFGARCQTKIPIEIRTNLTIDTYKMQNQRSKSLMHCTNMNSGNTINMHETSAVSLRLRCSLTPKIRSDPSSVHTEYLYTLFISGTTRVRIGSNFNTRPGVSEQYKFWATFLNFNLFFEEIKRENRWCAGPKASKTVVSVKIPVWSRNFYVMFPHM